MRTSPTLLVTALALALAACGGGDGLSLPPPALEQPAKLLLDESFDKNGELPAGWRLANGSAGSATVRDGSLYIDGRKHSSTMTTVLLPESLQTQANYRVDIDFSYLERNDAARWGSIVYRAAAGKGADLPTPYYQFAMRANASASNGAELAQRTAKDTWNVIGKKAHGEDIVEGRVYRASVVVHGNRVRHYLDGTLLHDQELDPAQAQGGLGLSTAGLVMKVDRIKVSEQATPLPELDGFIAVQDSGTRASMAPTLVQPMRAGTDLSASRASQALYELDAKLSLRGEAGEDLGSLKALLSRGDRRTLPVLRIRDQATVQALVALSATQDLADLTLLSDQVELLRSARQALPKLRSALDLSADTRLGANARDVLSVVQSTNRALAKIVVLPQALLQRASIEHVQRLLITPWARSSASTQAEAAELLVSGVNGVIASHGTVFAEVLARLPANTLLRKPLITGHRGMPGKADENTIEGSRLAVEAGADAVENDIYLTTDGHLVVMHDATVNRTTNGTGEIEKMSLAEVKKLRTKSGYAVPTLEDYFVEFKNNKKVTLFVEIKSTKPEILAPLRALIERHGVADQLVLITFHGAQLQRLKTELPGVTGGFLTGTPNTGKPGADLRAVLDETQTYSSTFNPSYANLAPPLLEAAKHRGTTFWPWTFRDRKDFNRFYSYGIHGLTTDDAWWAADFVTSVASARSASASAGQPFTLPLTLLTQGKGTRSAPANRFVVLGDAPAHTVNADGSLSFKLPGSALVMPGYVYQMDENSAYTVFGAPVSVTVR
ncbi:DUF1080 domain-containing protein [Pelomonas sp. CA6]|uniref:glycerophosphodiester phosphodiesterase family protein n=1 Tax=Pelomonas sp. CA6 TaxID=2907999 RepID=UPI001F4B2B09|nr:glycerophosphodiester phosphodiesterase family protein [Pelomonas sp. CA6]MCH7341785.1 DUF1080 domain-containing protein [Pelomonas sp. CA6]